MQQLPTCLDIRIANCSLLVAEQELWYTHGQYCKNVKNSEKLLTIKTFFDCSSLAFNTNERKVKFVAVETWTPFIHVGDEIYSVLRFRKITSLFL